MKTTTTILSTLSLLASILAAPTPQSSTTTSSTPATTNTANGPLGLMSIRSGSDIQYAQLAARDLGFYIGEATSTYCPNDVEGLDCSQYGNATQLRLGEGRMSMDVGVPGGQQVYISPTGALSFTSPHSAYIPEGSITDGFSITNYTSFSSLTNTAGGFVACPVDAEKGGLPYQVFVQTEGFSGEGCEGFDLAAVVGNAPAAWEYS